MTTAASEQHRRDSAWQGPGLFVAIVLAVTAIRLIGLAFSVVEVNVDEAQYWDWSRHFAFGYFSKPPLIAWIIGATTAVCGEGEACIRVSSPLLYAGTSLAVYFTADALYDRRTAFFAGLTILFALAVVFSARIISTDVPLLFFWALALLAYIKRLKGGGPVWLAGLAIAFGLGLLAKYAMAYFIAGMVLAAILSDDGRRALRDRGIWTALAIGLLALIPNIAWNMRNDFVTLHHLGGNVSGDGITPDFGEMLEFVVSQFAVGGPVVFAVLLYVFVRPRAARLTRDDRVLLAFTLPPLVVVTILSYVTRAYPNWAAVAYISASILAPALLLRWQRRWLLVSGIGLGIIVQAILLTGDSLADRIDFAALGVDNPYRETMGTGERAATVERLARAAGANTIVLRTRRDLSGFTYYLRDSGLAIRAWPRWGEPTNNYYQQAYPLTDPYPDPLVALFDCTAGPEGFVSAFRETTSLGVLTLDRGGGRIARDHVYRLAGPAPGLPRPQGCQQDK